MSECKHEWYLKSGRGYVYCGVCGKTVPVENYFEQLEQENADLHSKLNKTYRGLESLTPGGSEFHNDVQSCVDYIKDRILTLEGLVKDHARRRIAAEQERDNLQAQLNGMTEARDTFYNDIVRYKKSCDDLIKLRDELFDKVDALTAERDNLQAQVNSLKTTLEHCDLARDKWLNKYVDLQAANAVLRGALEYYKTHEDGGVRAVQALSTTPDEAGERVRGLVEALAEYVDWCTSKPRKSDEEEILLLDEITGRAKDALAKYRGGADNG